MMDARTQAIGLRIGTRWFCKFDRRQRVVTAWSLAGARLFHCARDAAETSEIIAARRGVPPEMVQITAGGQPPSSPTTMPVVDGEAPERLDEAAAMRRMRAADRPAFQEADVTLCPICCGAGEVTTPDGQVCRCGGCQGTGED